MIVRHLKLPLTQFQGNLMWGFKIKTLWKFKYDLYFSIFKVDIKRKVQTAKESLHFKIIVHHLKFPLTQFQGNLMWGFKIKALWKFKYEVTRKATWEHTQVRRHILVKHVGKLFHRVVTWQLTLFLARNVSANIGETAVCRVTTFRWMSWLVPTTRGRWSSMVRTILQVLLGASSQSLIPARRRVNWAANNVTACNQAGNMSPSQDKKAALHKVKN